MSDEKPIDEPDSISAGLSAAEESAAAVDVSESASVEPGVAKLDADAEVVEAQQAVELEAADSPEAVASEAADQLTEGDEKIGASSEEIDDEIDGEVDDDEQDSESTLVVAPAGPIEELTEEDLAEDVRLDWYILKVQSNRERTSSEALKRKVAIEGIDRYFGEIIVPTEKVTEFKNGKKKTVNRKIWPGYIAVQMHVNDDTWFAIRETSGIGDFTGASGKPIPMSPADVEKILPKDEGEEGTEEETPKLNIKFAEGDKVKVTDGNFENFEGDVDAIDQQSGKITVMISIFGRSTPVELEYWQVEKL